MLEAEDYIPAVRITARRTVASLGDNVRAALYALRQNGLRSALTLAGIVIGMIAIVTLIAILQGVKVEIRNQVQGLGTNLVMIVPGKLDENGQPNPGALAGLSTLSEEDVDALRRVPGVEKISPVYIISGTVEADAANITPAKATRDADGAKSGNKTKSAPSSQTSDNATGKRRDGKSASALVVATNKVGVQMNPTPLSEGHYYEDGDGRVCILGYRPRHDLFGDGPALGKTVHIQGHDWKVVGVLGKPDAGGSLGSALLSLNTLVYVPSPIIKELLPGSRVNRIALETDYKHPAEGMTAQINATLLRTHEGYEDFGVITQEKGLALVIHILNMAQSLLVLIAGISLFVAGVGIMNIMLVTVTERTREIGVRKTVGARRSDIFLQFLVEAVVLSLLGGIIGLIISWFACRLIAHYSPLTPIITWALVGLALAVCTAVGVLFGVAPAVRASRLNPIDALRHE